LTDRDEAKIVSVVESSAQTAKIFGAIVAAAASVALAISGWALVQVIDHAERISVIESNRFTAGDAAALIAERDALFLRTTDRLSTKLDELTRVTSDLRVLIAEKGIRP